jgi:hypothetical protein
MSQVRSLSGPPFINKVMLENFIRKVAVLDKNFLTDLECADIQTKLFSIKNLWRTSPVKYFYYLPTGMYNTSSEVYKKNLSYKPIMYNLFGNYYERLHSKLISTFDMDIQYHDDLSYPGFHISNSESMSVPNFHCDGFIFSRFLKGKDKLYYNNPKYFSLIIPIALPNDDSGLLIRTSKSHNKRHDLMTYDQELIYSKGMLAIWDGNIEHSIKPFIITEENQYRITMQLHLAIANNKGYIFW